MSEKKYLKESIKLGDKELTVESGRVAKQADGSVVIRYGDTMLLVAAVGAPTPAKELISFPSRSSIVNQTMPPGAFPVTTSGAKAVRMKRKS